MTHRSPLLTLGAVVLWFVAMLTVNYIAHPPGAQPQSAPAPAPNATASAAGPAPTSAAPTAGSTPQPTRTQRSDDPEFGKKVVYAGKTRNGALGVAVAVLDGKAAAYVCDGKGVEAWLTGRTDGDEVELRSQTGVSIEAELRADGRLDGKVEISGKDYGFRISEAKKPAGLYRGDGPKTTIGWIVLPDGSQVGVATSDGTSKPAPELDPAAATIDVGGETVTVTPVTGDGQY